MQAFFTSKARHFQSRAGPGDHAWRQQGGFHDGSAAEAGERERPRFAANVGSFLALALTADGDLAGRRTAFFTPEHFPGEKQDDFVREEAYMEVQVQLVLELARGREMHGGKRGRDDRLGNEDTTLPFTFRGFWTV